MPATSSTYHLALGLLAVLATVAVCLLSPRLPDRLFQLERRHVLLLGTAWVLALTAEYWAFGVHSFVQINDEGELTVPLLKYMAEHFSGGLYAHGIAGGNDIQAMVGYNNQTISLERALFALLPTWAALGANKLLAASAAFAGAYLLARRGAGTSRFAALAIACFHTLAHRYMIAATLFQGIGIQLAPLAAYVTVVRLDRRAYLPAVLAVSILHAVSSGALYFAPALGFAVLLVWLARGCPRPLRFLIGAAILALPTIANWLEIVLALVQVAPYSSLMGRNVGGDLAGNFGKYFLGRSPQSLILAVTIIAWLCVRGSRGTALKASGLILAAWLIGPVMLALPWQSLGLATFQAYDWFYVSMALPTVLILTGGWAAAASGPEPGPSDWRWLRPAILFLAMAGGEFAYLKAHNITQWVGFGGHSLYYGYDNLVHRDWAPDHPFRVASVPYRLDPDTVSAYGLESFDGFVTNHPADRSLFWRHAICGDRPGCPWILQTYVTAQSMVDFQCCRSYPVARILPGLDALRVGNVEFVLSTLPIEGLEQVSGPSAETVPPRRDDPLWERVRGLVRLLLQPGPVHIYRVPDALPRAFAAVGSQSYPPGADDPTMAALAVSAALERRLVLRQDALATLPPAGTGQVTKVTPVRDGYDFDVTLPEGGLLALNASWTPFWHAEADGVEVPTASANLVLTAIAVPPGTRRISLRYKRPTLGILLAGRLSRD